MIIEDILLKNIVNRLKKNVRLIRRIMKFDKKDDLSTNWNNGYIKVAVFLIDQINTFLISREDLIEYSMNQRNTLKKLILKLKDNPHLRAKYAGQNEVFEDIFLILKKVS